MKIPELQSILRKKKIDFALFGCIDFERPDPDIAYFTGYTSVGFLVIPKKKKSFLLVPEMEANSAKKSPVKVKFPKKKKPLLKLLVAILKKNKIKPKKIGINSHEVTLYLKKAYKASFKKAKYTDISKELAKLRETKTKKEIDIIKQGCKISDIILNKCIKNWKSFKTEADVKAFLEHETKKQGCDLAFPTIVASGKNATEVHHITDTTKIKNGFCLIDFGLKYKNYCTDTTRTLYIGKPSKKDEELYHLLLNSQKAAIESIKLNKRAKEVVATTNKALGRYSKYFTHGLGHGFGIKIHELPNLKPDSNDRLKENSVVTVEPGIYLKNKGIRIEDNILIKKNGIEILTKAPKNLITL